MSEEITVILANGTYPHSRRALSILSCAEHVVCCDGAAVGYFASGGRPDAVIGDLDSLDAKVREALSEVIVHVTEQDTNDLNKAFRYCLSRGWRHLVILGATGKREDHTLGNISLLADFAEQGADIRMVTDDGEFVVMTCSGKVKCRTGQQISVFSLNGSAHIESSGLKWPLDGVPFTRWWQGTLNEATGDELELRFGAGATVLVYFAGGVL